MGSCSSAGGGGGSREQEAAQSAARAKEKAEAAAAQAKAAEEKATKKVEAAKRAAAEAALKKDAAQTQKNVPRAPDAAAGRWNESPPLSPARAGARASSPRRKGSREGSPRSPAARGRSNSPSAAAGELPWHADDTHTAAHRRGQLAEPTSPKRNASVSKGASMRGYGEGSTTVRADWDRHPTNTSTDPGGGRKAGDVGSGGGSAQSTPHTTGLGPRVVSVGSVPHVLSISGADPRSPASPASAPRTVRSQNEGSPRTVRSDAPNPRFGSLPKTQRSVGYTARRPSRTPGVLAVDLKPDAFEAHGDSDHSDHDERDGAPLPGSPAHGAGSMRSPKRGITTAGSRASSPRSRSPVRSPGDREVVTRGGMIEVEVPQHMPAQEFFLHCIGGPHSGHMIHFEISGRNLVNPYYRKPEEKQNPVRSGGLFFSGTGDNGRDWKHGPITRIEWDEKRKTLYFPGVVNGEVCPPFDGDLPVIIGKLKALADEAGCRHDLPLLVRVKPDSHLRSPQRAGSRDGSPRHGRGSADADGGAVSSPAGRILQTEEMWRRHQSAEGSPRALGNAPHSPTGLAPHPARQPGNLGPGTQRSDSPRLDSPTKLQCPRNFTGIRHDQGRTKTGHFTGRPQVLARGSYTAVMECHDEAGPVQRGMSPPLCVKVIMKGRTLEHGREDDVTREANALQLLSHPNIVSLVAWCETTTAHLCVMSYVAGHSGATLHHRLLRLQEQHGSADRLPPDEVFDIVEGVALALEHCHGNRVAHRAVSPHHVVFDAVRRGRKGCPSPVLCGFGHCAGATVGLDASLIDDARVGHGLPNAAISAHGSCAEYNAPEVILSAIDRERARLLDGCAVDMWCLGMLLGHCFHGVPLFEHADPGQLNRLITQCQFKLRPHLPADAVDLIERLLQPDPQQRMTLPAAADHWYFGAQGLAGSRTMGANPRDPRFVAAYVGGAPSSLRMPGVTGHAGQARPVSPSRSRTPPLSGRSDPIRAPSPPLPLTLQPLREAPRDAVREGTNLTRDGTQPAASPQDEAPPTVAGFSVGDKVRFRNKAKANRHAAAVKPPPWHCGVVESLSDDRPPRPRMRAGDGEPRCWDEVEPASRAATPTRTAPPDRLEKKRPPPVETPGGQPPTQRRASRSPLRSPSRSPPRPGSVPRSPLSPSSPGAPGWWWQYFHKDRPKSGFATCKQEGCSEEIKYVSGQGPLRYHAREKHGCCTPVATPSKRVVFSDSIRPAESVNVPEMRDGPERPAA